MPHSPLTKRSPPRLRTCRGGVSGRKANSTTRSFPMGVLQNVVAERDGVVIAGEYTHDETSALATQVAKQARRLVGKWGLYCNPNNRVLLMCDKDDTQLLIGCIIVISGVRYFVTVEEYDTIVTMLQIAGVDYSAPDHTTNTCSVRTVDGTVYMPVVERVQSAVVYMTSHQLTRYASFFGCAPVIVQSTDGTKPFDVATMAVEQ